MTALLFVLAVATSGINGWFYVGNYGVPWFDIQPVIASHPVTSMFLALSIATGLLAAWQHFRMDYAGHTEVKDNRRNRVLASTPLLVVATIMVLGEVGSLAKGAVFRYPLYTTAKANLAAITSGLSPTSCAMADDVLTEPDPNVGLLQPVPGQTFGPDGPLGGATRSASNPTGWVTTCRSYPVVTKPGVVNSDASPNKPNAAMSDSAGTAGGKGPVGVNGSNVALPFGLDPARTPVMGSYGENTAGRHRHLVPGTSYRRGLPDRPIVVVSASGAIWSYKEDGTFTYGQSLKLQWGVTRPDGTTQPLGEVQPIDIGPEPAWRNLRFPLTWAPPEANVARIVAVRPEPELGSVVRVHAAAGPGAADAAATDRIADAGADGHRDRRELPVPAAVLRTPWRRRTSGVPHPARPQTDGVVVERVAGRRGRRPVPVHPGAAADLDDLDVPARRLVSRLGIGRAVLPAGAQRSGAECRRRTGRDDRERLEPARTDSGTAMSVIHHEEQTATAGALPATMCG